VKSATVLFCLLLVFANGLAQESIIPTNHLELFNGRDFSAWTFCMKGHADPALTWSVTNGVIHCTGKPAGYLRTLQRFNNYRVTVVWRFVTIAPKADNTGVLVHMQLPDQIWPECVQNQGKSGRQGDLFLMGGAESLEHRGLDKNTPLPLHGKPDENPVGQWNTNATICAGAGVKACINGRLLNETTDCTVSSGLIGIQSEGAEIEIRRIYLEPLE
jgi:hypothetical protein